MEKKKSIVNDNYGPIEKTDQASTTSKGGKKANTRMFQNIILIWLDNNIDENNEDFKQGITQLRRVVSTINTFTDTDQCTDFLTDIYKERVFMVISDEFYKNIVPLIHDVTQLHTIVIFNKNKTGHEQWAKEWYKIKGFFTEISPMCEVLQQAGQECEQNAISISFVATNDDIRNTNLDQLDPTFMYTQILKEILLSLEFEEKHMKEFIDYCRVNKEGTLNGVNELEREYHNKTPIWWYTSECFVYSTLNCALRLMDVDIILKMGWFIRDLHRDIEQRHKEQFGECHSNESFTIYRGQGMSKENFDRLIKTKGGLLSFNNFLSTSKDRDISLFFAESSWNNPDMIGILFVITIEHTESTTPFASVNGISAFEEEDEILFSMHTVFRIREIKPMNENRRLFQVDLTLTSDHDKDLLVLADHIRKDSGLNSRGWFRLGLLLINMGYPDKAQHVYEVLLEKTMNVRSQIPIYNELGLIKYVQGAYKEAIAFHEKVLKLEQNILAPDDSSFAVSYANIGNAYDEMGEHSKALSFLEKALIIQQKRFPPNYFYIALVYSNIGIVYYKLGEYSKALSSHEKALETKQKELPSNHPSLAMSYDNIGTLYGAIGEFSKALSYNRKALEIRQQSLPPNHPELAYSYNNIASSYISMGEYSEALPYRKKILEIKLQSLPPNHPELASYYNRIAIVYINMAEYSKALPYCKKTLEIKQLTLPPNHPELASSHSSIALVYADMDEYSKALSFFKKALEIEQQTLPRNHPDLASLYNAIGGTYHNMGEYSKARPFLERAVDIARCSLPSNHPSLQIFMKNLDTVIIRCK